MPDEKTRILMRSMDNSPSFFNHIDESIVKSLARKSTEQLNQKKPPMDDSFEAAAARYQYRTVIQRRMMMLLPFHLSLQQLLQRDPADIGFEELEPIERNSRSKMEENPNDSVFRKLLPSICIYLGRIEDAKSSLRSSLEADRKFAEGWFMSGSILYGEGLIEDAHECLKKAHELDTANKLLNDYLKYVSLLILMASKK